MKKIKDEYEECDGCDGCGWHEKGATFLKIHCNKCNGTGKVVIHHTKAAPIPKLSKQLAKRTALTPAQLERVKGEGGGAASKYDSSGKQSLALTRRLAAARRKAKKLVLYTDQLGRRLYIGDRAKMNLRDGVLPLTFDKDEALIFFEGFDDTTQAARQWSIELSQPLLNFISTHI